MVDDLMKKTAIIKASIAHIVVGINRAASFDMLLHEGLKRLTIHIGYGNRSDISIYLNDADDQCFPGGTSATLPLASSTKLSFVDLNVTGQLAGEMVALNGLSDLSKHLPGYLVSYADFSLQLIGRNTNLEDSNSADQFGNRRPGLIKDRARGFRKCIFTASTLVFKAVSLPEFPNSLMSTYGTLYPTWPTNFMKKIVTFTLVRKIVSIFVKTHRVLLHLDSSFPSMQLVPLRG
jgi:hypothetical protein